MEHHVKLDGVSPAIPPPPLCTSRTPSFAAAFLLSEQLNSATEIGLVTLPEGEEDDGLDGEELEHGVVGAEEVPRREVEEEECVQRERDGYVVDDGDVQVAAVRSETGERTGLFHLLREQTCSHFAAARSFAIASQPLATSRLQCMNGRLRVSGNCLQRRHVQTRSLLTEEQCKLPVSQP